MTFAESRIDLFALTKDPGEVQAAFREKRTPKRTGG
jgi:hypothetical protein